MRTPEEIARQHGERLAARAAINNTPFNDDVKILYTMKLDGEPMDVPDYTYEVSMEEDGQGRWVYSVQRVTREPIATAADAETANRIAYALEQYEGV